ncbi:transposase [Streptomyces sp. NPDC055287]
MARGDLTDKQWGFLKAVLPPSPVMGREPRDRRQDFNGIWWRARTGSPWRDLPERRPRNPAPAPRPAFR